MAKTALELTREEWKQYNPIRPRAELVDEARRERAWAVAREAATLLREQYGATRVVAFGSLAHGAWFTERSDIDLAAWGIPSDAYFRAWSDVERLTNEFQIDLLTGETLIDIMHERIEQRGEEL